MRNKDHKVIETFADKEYIVLHPSYQSKHSKISESQEIFSYDNYKTHYRAPVKVLEASPIASQRCLDMPLRLAGDSEYRLPINWIKIRSILESLISIEHANNPHWKDYHTYLTIDVKNVMTNEQQRHGGLHVDGFQGERIIDKTKITRNYVGTTNGGTQFWNQPFKVVDPAKFNVFEGFDLQRVGMPFIAVPDCFYFMDAYMVHESGYADHDGLRVFMRLTYDMKKFDRLGNTHNPNLDYNWDMVERHVWNHVTTPTVENL